MTPEIAAISLIGLGTIGCYRLTRSTHRSLILTVLAFILIITLTPLITVSLTTATLTTLTLFIIAIAIQFLADIIYTCYQLLKLSLELMRKYPPAG